MTVELATVLAQVLPVFALAAIVEIRALLPGGRIVYGRPAAADDECQLESGSVDRPDSPHSANLKPLYIVALSLGVIALGGQEVVALYALSGFNFWDKILTISDPIFTASTVVAILCVAPGARGLNAVGQYLWLRCVWRTRSSTRANRRASSKSDSVDSPWVAMTAAAIGVLAFLASLLVSVHA
jgi:hypothetical protein